MLMIYMIKLNNNQNYHKINQKLIQKLLKIVYNWKVNYKNKI